VARRQVELEPSFFDVCDRISSNTLQVPTVNAGVILVTQKTLRPFFLLPKGRIN
jgi:hypothetical protein